MKCYQLLMASQGWGSRADNYNCIDPATHQPGSLFGQSACGASAWADMYYANMWKTIEGAGLGGFAPTAPTTAIPARPPTTRTTRAWKTASGHSGSGCAACCMKDSDADSI